MTQKLRASLASMSLSPTTLGASGSTIGAAARPMQQAPSASAIGRNKRPRAAHRFAARRPLIPTPGAATAALPTAQTIPTAQTLPQATSEANWDALMDGTASMPRTAKAANRFSWFDAPAKVQQHFCANVDRRRRRGRPYCRRGKAGVLRSSVLRPPAGRKVDIRLARRPNELGATLAVDGESVGIPVAGPWQFPAPPGQHQIVAERGAFKYETAVALESGNELAVEPRWKPKAELALTWPIAERTGATLTIDGRAPAVSQQQPQQQPLKLPVEPGRHIVRVVRADCEPFESVVTVADDGMSIVTVLMPSMPTLVLDWPAAERHDAGN